MVSGVRLLGDKPVSAKWQVIMLWALAIGLFIQISGRVWIVSGSARNAQVYLWLLLPALIFFYFYSFKRNRAAYRCSVHTLDCFSGMGSAK